MGHIIIKTPEQIEGIRKSCKLASKCLNFIESYVVAGVTTGKLDDLLEGYIRDQGAIPAPKGYQVDNKIYPKATCISLNEVVCHGIPDEKTILKDGDILNIDVTTILDGYFGDTSRMYTVGKVSQEALDLIATCKRCLDLGIKQVKPGAHLGNIGYVIQREAESEGYSVVRDYCGHGVGRFFHEPPQVAHYGKMGTGVVMMTGMTFTIEPMLNQGAKDVVISEADGWTAMTADGKLSAQWEHQILITMNGYEVLTI